MDLRSGANLGTNLGQAHFPGSSRFGTGTFGCRGVRTQPEPLCSDPVWGMRGAFGVGASQTFSIMGGNLGHLAQVLRMELPRCRAAVRSEC
jgi:hypothetical protein